MFFSNSSHRNLFPTFVSFILIFILLPKPSSADPPICEAYKVSIVTKDGTEVIGYIQTRLDEYVEYHEPGKLNATDFLKRRNINEPENVLRIYDEIYQFKIPKGFNILALPNDRIKIVKKDSITSIKILTSRSCSGEKEYSYIFPSSIYEVPFDCIEKLQKGKYHFVEIHRDEEKVCWFAVGKENSDRTVLKKIFNNIQKDDKWYDNHKELNKKLWEQSKIVLFCSILEW